jgi:hypothetical protein
VSALKSKAIILASGPGDAATRDLLTAEILETLKPFSLSVSDSQSIALSGRVIIALEIELDPAHASAIEKDLISILSPKNFDIALETL